jgi:hypothetical protein
MSFPMRSFNLATCNCIVIAMKARPAFVRRMGNSLGVTIPKPVKDQDIEW